MDRTYLIRKIWLVILKLNSIVLSKHNVHNFTKCLELWNNLKVSFIIVEPNTLQTYHVFLHYWSCTKQIQVFWDREENIDHKGRPVFSTGGSFALHPPWGHLPMSGDFFDHHNCDGVEVGCFW